LDEMMPRKLKRLFPSDVEVVTVQERGWDSLENGDLLRAARDEFDALLTTDKGIPHQQDLSGIGLTVVVLEAESNRLEHLSPLMEEANDVLRRALLGDTGEAGGVWRVGSEDRRTKQ
jgi:hypothetical protein